MADWKDPRSTQAGFGVSPNLTGDIAGRTTFDAGLRRHMLSIYNYMASAVALTGVVAYLTFQMVGREELPNAVALSSALGTMARIAGPGIGGLLNVTFGNLPELIIAFIALNAGLYEVFTYDKRNQIGTVWYDGTTSSSPTC